MGDNTESYEDAQHSLDHPSLKEIEESAITTRLEIFKGKLTNTAKSLGIGRATMYRKIKEYKIDLEKIRRGF